MGIADSRVVDVTERICMNISKISRVFWGITHHGVFINSHIEGYNHTIAVIYKSPDGKEEWLPITDPDGTPGI